MSGHCISAAEAGGTRCFMDALQIVVLLMKNIEVQGKVSCENSTYRGQGVKMSLVGDETNYWVHRQ